MLLKLAKFTVKQLARVSFLIKLPALALACNFIEKETLAQRFCYEFWDIFKNTFLYKTSPMAVSENSNGKHQCKNAVKENNWLLNVLCIMFGLFSTFCMKWLTKKNCFQNKPFTQSFQGYHFFLIENANYNLEYIVFILSSVHRILIPRMYLTIFSIFIVSCKFY